jgi:hypothetical protein
MVNKKRKKIGIWQWHLYYPNLFQSSFGEVYCREELEINLKVLFEPIKKRQEQKK